MDHLLTYDCASKAEFLVPFVCADEDGYDGHDFLEYPFRRGWTTLKDPFGWCECETQELAIRAQSWLYFGLLSAWLGEDIIIEELLESDNTNIRGDDTSLPTASNMIEGQNLKSLRMVSGIAVQRLVIAKLESLSRVPENLDSSAFKEILRQFTKRAFVCYLASSHMDLLDRISHSRNIALFGDKHSYLSLISISIRILLDLLIKSTAYAQKLQPNGLAPVCKSSPAVSDSWDSQISIDSDSQLLRQYMMAKGWCPFQFQRFKSRFSTSTMMYLASLPSLGTTSEDHQYCTKHECKAYHSNSNTYQPSHTEDCIRSDAQHNCPDIEFQSEDVVNIIKGGDIPLISFTTDVNGSPKFSLVKGKPKDEYFVISHVWADGLGNPHANSLPNCQCRQLRESLSVLQTQMYEMNSKDTTRWKMEWPARLNLSKWNDNPPFPSYFLATLPQRIKLFTYYRPWKKKELRFKQPPSLFWMDTFCIPIGEENKTWYYKALNSMAYIYARASMMLVLTKQYREELPFEKTLCEIACSAWMSRSWTCQEASLAPDWHINGMRDIGLRLSGIEFDGNRIDDYWARFHKSVMRPSWDAVQKTFSADSIANELKAFYSDIVPRTEPWSAEWFYIRRMLVFTSAWNSLAGRTTTKPEDVDSIIALRLGFAPLDLLKIDPLWRMKSIFSHYKYLPTAILYDMSPKIVDSTATYSWIPKYPGVEVLDARNGLMQVTSKGLKLFSGLTPLGSSFPSTYTRTIIIPPIPRGLRQFSIYEPSLNLRLWISLYPQELQDDSQELSQSSASTCLLITELGDGVADLDDEASPIPRTFSPKGASLRIQQLNEYSLYAIYYCPIRISMFPPVSSYTGEENEPPECKAIALPTGCQVFIITDFSKVSYLKKISDPESAFDMPWFLSAALVLLIWMSVLYLLWNGIESHVDLNSSDPSEPQEQLDLRHAKFDLGCVLSVIVPGLIKSFLTEPLLQNLDRRSPQERWAVRMQEGGFAQSWFTLLFEDFRRVSFLLFVFVWITVSAAILANGGLFFSSPVFAVLSLPLYCLFVELNIRYAVRLCTPEVKKEQAFKLPKWLALLFSKFLTPFKALLTYLHPQSPFSTAQDDFEVSDSIMSWEDIIRVLFEPGPEAETCRHQRQSKVPSWQDLEFLDLRTTWMGRGYSFAMKGCTRAVQAAINVKDGFKNRFTSRPDLPGQVHLDDEQNPGRLHEGYSDYEDN